MSETTQKLYDILIAIEVEKDYADRLIGAGKKGRKYAWLKEDEFHAREELLRHIGSDIQTIESLYRLYRRKSKRSKFFIVPKVKEVLPSLEKKEVVKDSIC